jgi:transposase
LTEKPQRSPEFFRGWGVSRNTVTVLCSCPGVRVIAQRDFEGLERRRMRAARLLEQGETQASVARRLGVSRTTTTRWARELEAKGREGLRAAGRAGRKPQLAEEQVYQVEQALLDGPAAFGYSTELWTLPRVAELIGKLTGVRYHPGHVWRVLRRLGWSRQTPTTRARERADSPSGRRSRAPGHRQGAHAGPDPPPSRLAQPLRDRRRGLPVALERACPNPARHPHGERPLAARGPLPRARTSHLRGPVVLLWDSLNAHRSRSERGHRRIGATEKVCRARAAIARLAFHRHRLPAAEAVLRLGVAHAAVLRGAERGRQEASGAGVPESHREV